MSAKRTLNLDSLFDELGQFGRYQYRLYALLLPAILFNGIRNAHYVFTAADVSYRCFVPECESLPAQYLTGSWSEFALVPGSSCYRRVPLTPGTCTNDSFSQSTQACDQWVYQTNHTIVPQFNLACQEWKRTLVGTIYSLGVFTCLIFIGLISDSIGRRTTILMTSWLCVIPALLRVLIINYVGHLILEYLDALVSSGLYSCSFVLAMEMVGVDKRVFCGATIASVFAVGQMILAAIAYFVPQWKPLTLIIYVPSFIFLSYYFFLDESVRWLVSKQKNEKALILLQKVAKMNRKILPEHAVALLSHKKVVDQAQVKFQVDTKTLVYRVLRSRILMTRLAISSFSWITVTFVYYGLSINSVSLAGSMHINYVLTSLVEIPGYYTSVPMLNKFGRRYTIMASLLVCSVSLILLPFSSAIGGPGLVLALSLLGKFCVSLTFNGLYVQAAEMFPTPIRNSAIAICSLISRLGQVAAMMTPLLLAISTWVPYLTFGIMAAIAAFLLLLTPETLQAQLPDTIEEAEHLNVWHRGSISRGPSVKFSPSTTERIKQKQLQERMDTLG